MPQVRCSSGVPGERRQTSDPRRLLLLELPQRFVMISSYTLLVLICISGYFNAYDFAAHNTSADIFVHLGDYVRNISLS
jgi:hypothetical protein